MLSKQELLSYVRAAYQEYKDNYDDTFDDFIESRCMNASRYDKIRFNRNNANIM